MMTTHTKFFLSLLFLLCAINLYAQKHRRHDSRPLARLTGTLTFADGTPVSHASVFIQSLQKHTLSKDNGTFELVDIPFGKHILEVRTLEAEPEKREIIVNRRQMDYPVLLRENQNFNLSEVVVTGKNEAERFKEKGFAVNVIDTKKAELQPIRVDELLDRAAGVRIRQSGGLGSQIQYNINGLSGNSVRVFIDGLPLRNYGSSFSLSNIPPAQIERIEVYKGVVPAHLSEDALGGAINIVMKKSKETSKALSASYQYGSFNTHQGNVDGSYHHPKSGLTINGSAYYNYTDNNYKVWGDQVYVSAPPSWTLEYIKTERFHDSYQSYGLNANIGFTNVKWADRFTVGVLYADMDKDVQNGGTMEIVYGNRRTGQDTKMANLRYDKRNFLLRNLDVSTFVSLTRSDRSVIDTIPYIYNWRGEKTWDEEKNDYYQWNNNGGEQGRATLAVNKEKTIAGRGNLTYKLHPQHRLSANYLYNRFVRDVDDPLLPRAEQDLLETRYLTKQIFGLTYDNSFFESRLKSSFFLKHYIQSVKLKDPLTVDKELTYVEYDETMHHNGFGATASYAFWPEFMIRVSFEKALRMPESNEMLGNTSESIDATYDLKPEKSYNANLGFLIGPFDFGQHNLKADVNFFIRDISDMIMRQAENSKTGTYGYENLGKVISRGFDAELGYQYLSRFFATFNVSLFNARYNLRYDKNGKEYAYYNDRLRNAPYFTMNASAEYVLKNLFGKGARTAFTYNYGYVHEFYRNWESLGGAGKAVIPTQSIHDLSVLHTFPKGKLSMSVTAKNILNEQAFDNWALQKPGRAFYGKVTYRIF